MFFYVPIENRCMFNMRTACSHVSRKVGCKILFGKCCSKSRAMTLITGKPPSEPTHRLILGSINARVIHCPSSNLVVAP